MIGGLAYPEALCANAIRVLLEQSCGFFHGLAAGLSHLGKCF